MQNIKYYVYIEVANNGFRLSELFDTEAEAETILSGLNLEDIKAFIGASQLAIVRIGGKSNRKTKIIRL